MRHGQKAIDALLRDHPQSHVYFGEHASPDHFAIVLSLSDWRVMEDSECWVFLHYIGNRTFDTHWFCPRGLKIAAVRRMLAYAFTDIGAETLTGTTPQGHLNEKRARMLNRAVGAVPMNGGHVLTRERFFSYNKGRIKA